MVLMTEVLHEVEADHDQHDYERRVVQVDESVKGGEVGDAGKRHAVSLDGVQPLPCPNRLG